MSPNILIIDDDHSIRRSLKMILKAYGHECIALFGVEDVITIDGILQGFDEDINPVLVDLSTIAIAFCDARIDGSPDGWTIVPHLKAAKVYVIAISGTDQDKLLAAGADDQADKGNFPDYLKTRFAQDYAKAVALLAARGSSS